MSSFPVKSGQTFVFVGDSITDCGRRAAEFPFGIGYVKQTVDLITAKYPERNIRFINEGIGGNTVLDLRERWQDDVLYHKPNWVSIKIGINDLHRTLNDPNILPPKRYEELYREILDLTVKHTRANIILIDPFYMSTARETGGHRARVLEALPGYLKVVARLAKQYGALHIKTHSFFTKQLKYRQGDRICQEPVHPNASGHAIITAALLETLNW